MGYVLAFVVAVWFMVFCFHMGAEQGNKECHDKYGNDWSYTWRSATDCVNEKTGQGKFLTD